MSDLVIDERPHNEIWKGATLMAGSSLLAHETTETSGKTTAGEAEGVAPDTNNGGDDIWTVNDLARFLKVSTASIYGLRYRREGPRAIRVGRSLRWRRQDVLEWWDAREPA